MPDWNSLIDQEFSAERSLLLRYHRVFDKLDLQIAINREDAVAASIAEGARISKLAEYKGVEILLCDESSLMATGTYKDLDACLVTAVAHHAGLDSVVLSSGGNLGYALSVYGRRHNLNVYFFHPKSTLFKLDAANINVPGIKLISVDLPERQVKALSLAFSTKFALPLVPDIRWRLAASAVRAMFVLEHAGTDTGVDCIAQAMCAGYGPTGVYNCFSELSREGLLRRRAVPRFIGFQQEGNSPMVRAFSNGEREISAEHVHPEPKKYLEPGLYNTNPERNYTRLFDLMRYFGGDMLSIRDEDYERYIAQLLGWFRAKGLEFTTLPGTDQIMEKTGLLTGIGILRAIDEGRIRPQERVLYLMTGGFRKLPKTFTQAVPDVQVDESKSIDAWVTELGASFGLKPPAYTRRTDKLFKKDDRTT
ncbi:MAG: pyridoxal-phosphate dependent enzyme [Archangium sp.]|nr:pyridoxal-phosphate dependent enzyme [Archangium sp.]